MKQFMVFVAIFTLSCTKASEGLEHTLPCNPVNPNVAATGDPNLEWVTPAANGTRVELRNFCSGAAQTKVSYHIYFPEIYHTEPNRRFPVMYWLHGGGQGPGIEGIPALTNYFDNAIGKGLIPPMLIVFPNSPVRPYGERSIITMWVDSKDKISPVETILMEELIPHIDDTFRTMASRQWRALDGFSMGGYGGARLGFKHHDSFGAISILGAGPMQEMLVNTPRISPQAREALLKLIYGGSQDYFMAVSPRKLAEENTSHLQENMVIRIAVGNQDETYDDNRDFHEFLTQLGIPHEFIVKEGIPHNPMQLLQALGEENWGYYRKVFGNQ